MTYHTNAAFQLFRRHCIGNNTCEIHSPSMTGGTLRSTPGAHVNCQTTCLLPLLTFPDFENPHRSTSYPTPPPPVRAWLQPPPHSYPQNTRRNTIQGVTKCLILHLEDSIHLAVGASLSLGNTKWGLHLGKAGSLRPQTQDHSPVGPHINTHHSFSFRHRSKRCNVKTYSRAHFHKPSTHHPAPSRNLRSIVCTTAEFKALGLHRGGGGVSDFNLD